jgi:hypothetical protein
LDSVPRENEKTKKTKIVSFFNNIEISAIVVCNTIFNKFTQFDFFNKARPFSQILRGVQNVAWQLFLLFQTVTAQIQNLD